MSDSRQRFSDEAPQQIGQMCLIEITQLEGSVRNARALLRQRDSIVSVKVLDTLRRELCRKDKTSSQRRGLCNDRY